MMPKKKNTTTGKTKMPPLGSGMLKRTGNAIVDRKREQARILKKLGF
jgi:hypothetical protein